MNIALPSQSKQVLGGGFTFRRTFIKYAERAGVQISQDPEHSDVVLISGATMVERADVERWKAAGKKIVLRVDNIPRNSRNRNTGTSRLFDFAQMADLVVYQSNFARDYIQPFLKKDGPIIINGGDTDIFNTTGPKVPQDGSPQYMFAQYNRDETKQWHVAWYTYIMRQREEKGAHLWIAGNFSPEQVQYNFDFFMGERFRYWGVRENPEDMAELYRSTDVMLIPYYNDACSQTMVEARLCGVKQFIENGTGGNNDIMNAPIEKLSAAFMVASYLSEIEKAL